MATIGAAVAFADKVRHKAQEMRGRIKRNTGEVIGDPRLEAEGTVDEAAGKLKQTGDRVKDALRGRPIRRRPRY
ncbi:MAG: CsbD family protein [Pseudonocardia sp.]|jgi:uncharacterized protein YjbJ (UPF0337 family)|nr:CsbD family protein [Pseudonocardia sp.]